MIYEDTELQKFYNFLPNSRKHLININLCLYMYNQDKTCILELFKWNERVNRLDII